MKAALVLFVLACALALASSDLVCGSKYCKQNPCSAPTITSNKCRSPAVYRPNHAGKCACCPACVTLLCNMKAALVLFVLACALALASSDLVCGSKYCKQNPCSAPTITSNKCRSPAVYRPNHAGKCACCPACVTLLCYKQVPTNAVNMEKTNNIRHRTRGAKPNGVLEPRNQTKQDPEFTNRESPLTVLIQGSLHLRAIYHIFVVILLILLCDTVIYDLVERGNLIWKGLAITGLATLQTALVAVPVWDLGRKHLALASGATVTCEMFRFVMKIHAVTIACASRWRDRTALPTRCREWERQRRNKFNDAITRLGEAVRAIHKVNDSNEKDTENVQLPKIEIVQKAIVCLTNCAQEKTQLNEKYLKLLMLKKSKRNALKEKSVLTTNATVESEAKKGSKYLVNNVTPPKILPKCDIMAKKRTENTIVVLPAAPYLFPQRPLFLPAVPPAFVIVDPNMQTLNKPSVPVVNRTVGDTTKTTMEPAAVDTEISMTNESSKDKKKDVEMLVPDKSKEVLVSNTSSQCVITPPKTVTQTKTDNNAHTNKENDEVVSKNKETIDSSKVMETSNNNSAEITENVDINQKSLPLTQTNQSEIHKEVNICIKTTSVEDKDKENKLPNILDTALCENGVDGGNARLELAEEFLAASPTAAFLMSFPLVSGNRADSPADDTSNAIQPNIKENATAQLAIPPPSTDTYFEKPNSTDIKTKAILKQLPASSNTSNKQPSQHKYVDNNAINKPAEIKSSNSIPITNVSTDNPFLSLTMPSIIITTTQPDTFTLDFDCSMSKTVPSQSSSYVTSSNLFYKSDPFSNVKSTIYSTSSIASGHEFNTLGLYPCAMEKYSKNKSDYTNVEDNLMKIGSSRLTYDIDLGWSHKGFDFVNCSTNANSFSKDILTTATAPSYSSTYNPFNPEFHVPLVSSSNKKDTTNKPISSFADTITSFYSAPQPTNLWSEEMCFYNNSSAPKTLPNKHQNYLHLDHAQPNSSIKPILTKQYDSKPDAGLGNVVKPPNETIRQQIPDKYHKKSPSKMHINWMTSELRPMQNNCNPSNTGMKDTHKQAYVQVEHNAKKQEHNEGNYFPITMHNFPTQPPQEDFQVWPSTRPLGTTEISIEPPPINLPTLVGDLALGPHDKKKNADITNRVGAQTDIQNCSNFLSVTQLMNRSSDNSTSRYHGSNTEAPKPVPAKQTNTQFPNDSSRKTMTTRIETNIPQPCYVFNDLKPINSYENMGQFSQSKSKANKNDKSAKVHKHSYSAEALIRSGTCTQKVQDQIGPKFMTPSQKYSDFNTTQDTSVAQVSHFPPILDYSDNSFSGQQFSGTTLYNSTTNTISNSFYSNFMSSSANIMSGSYASAPFTGDFMDYNQPECNYNNNKYEEFKMRSNSSVFQDKVPSNYKSSRRDSGAKHKLECSKKESSKKYQNKRAKLSNEVEEWSDSSNLFWQNKGQNKKHPNLMSEEFTFANYVGNQMAPQYQHELFNSHLVGGMQPGPGGDRSLASFPATSRANFNLSTIFPEITMLYNQVKPHQQYQHSLAAVASVSSGEQFTLGYITGSKRRGDDMKYSMPGLVISGNALGAISMAVAEVNEQLLGPMNHSLHFIVAETYGKEEESILQVATLWAANVSAFIGPQETCVHEGRMAAAFNLPMISYYCRDVASSNKEKYATFARTRPSDTDISRAVVAVLTHYNFKHVSIVYLNAPTKDFSRLANAIITAVREKQISVLRIESYQHSYHFIDTQENYTLNPFLDIVRKTYKDTRIYVSVGNYYDHLGLMMALDAMQLLDSGEYAAIGVDVEKYDPEQAVAYLSGPLRTEPLPARAFRSFLAVTPSPAPSYSDFAAKVNQRLTEPPFNFSNPLVHVSSKGAKVQDSSATGNGNAMVIVSGNPEKSGGSAGGVRSSQVSLSSNPDLDFRYSAIFTEVALYRGRLLSVKRIRRHQIDITREIKKELKIMRDLQHDNVNGFVGACIEPPNYHGALRPSNCLVDARWVVKLADFGLRAFRAGELPPTEPNDIRSHIDSLVYLAPELLRAAGWGDAAAAEPCEGSPAADVYAFALVLYEMHTRRGPFGADAPPGPALLRRLATAQPTPYRPPVDVLTAQFDCSRECCVECWAEEPALRPDFKAIRTRLRPLRKGMKPNIFDNMIAMMEKYANNLEVLVDERTDQLQEEKKKTEALLEEMLPVPVAEQLKRGHRVMPESYDSVTIYFSDIVGFTAMSAESTPLQVVDFLNDLYTCFDSILENFDVYKVETIGDAYMVVSGLPIRNGIMHAGEVASMALALLSATQSFRVRHRPDQRLLLRVGIHSGPVCAGVVGLKMPRYCLFGDTVNTASRFESTGAPLKIHCSSTCKGLLDKLGGYILEERGIVAMKGKRDQVTYWLKGEEKETAAARAHRRAQAEGASQLAAEKRGQRSSLKNKSWKNQIGVLHRCCSLESPKKLRFASGNLLELSHTDSVLHHRSDEYLMEVIGDSRLAPAQRGDLLEAPSLRHEHTSVSCPIIEHTETSPVPLATNSCATLPHDHKRTKPCDIKLVVNGCSYNENEAGIPLLADA
ncbi:hypothetical protein MSG28_003502 [Choristoneura fumiferana]|uniref:Uncharacterized protein n=1 Tax=Choristoneura fumiferana TaxID=7141 RepID=A0ACC0KFA3_CHOFU|nr:hypothetical protein MSG28_003502 [Choristoneura fumiferana]